VDGYSVLIVKTNQIGSKKKIRNIRHHFKSIIKQNDGAHPREYGYERLFEIIDSSDKWWF